MAQKLRTTRSGLPVITLDDSGIVVPSFTFEPYAGRKPLDEIPADLVLVTKLYRHDIPAALHLREPSVGELLKTTVREGFSGKKGTTELLRVPLLNSRGDTERFVLMVGLGPATSYCGRTACNVFETLFNQALDLGVSNVLVPFIPNPMTKYSLTHKATAFKLKSVLKQVLAQRGGAGALQEIKIYCHPAAVRYIQEGLSIDHGEACSCSVRQ
jgi:hypothetical protein